MRENKTTADYALKLYKYYSMPGKKDIDRIDKYKSKLVSCLRKKCDSLKSKIESKSVLKTDTNKPKKPYKKVMYTLQGGYVDTFEDPKGMLKI